MCSGLAFDEMVQSPPLFAQTRQRRVPFWVLLHDHMAQRGGHLSQVGQSVIEASYPSLAPRSFVLLFVSIFLFYTFFSCCVTDK